MMTVNEVSKMTGVSIRTLQYYDTIGLLTLKKEHLENLIHFARGIKMLGVKYMDPASENVQGLVKKLKNYISEHFAGACKHLYIWEIVYSRVYTASACLTDEIERTCYIERDL